MSVPRSLPPPVRTTRSRPPAAGPTVLARGLASPHLAALAASLAVPLLGTALLLAGRWAEGGTAPANLGLHLLVLVLPLGAAGIALALRPGHGDPLLLPIAAALAGVGFVLHAGLGRQGSFAQGVALGAVAMVAASFLCDRTILREGSAGRPAYVWLPLACALTLSVALLLFGTGPGRSDAKVNLFGAQPIEAIRLLVALSLAGWFGRRWRLLRHLDEPPLHPRLRFLRLPRLDEAGPVALAVAATLLFFVLQRDLGPALLLIGVFLVLYAVCRRHVALAACALAAVVAGFAIADRLDVPHTVHTRVAMWRAPWESGRDQLAHALWGFAAGGLTGTGPGLGTPGEIPAVHTDLVLAAAGEELGLAGILCLAALYVLLAARGLRAARLARDAYASLLALAITAGIALQVLLIAGGALGLVPLSGVVTPFLSYGRSALVVHFASLGILWSVAAAGRRPEALGPRTTSDGGPLPPGPADAFARPLRVVAILLAACAAVVVGKAAWVQGVRADAVLARPVLVRQADGRLRYADDPRLRRMAEAIPRGSVLDRNGLPLATGSWEEMARQRDAYARLGIDLDRACSRDDSRHYPLGGTTWHLLGDLLTGTGWGAPNTAFVEREAQATLAGWDDRRTEVAVRDPFSGRPAQVERRDLSPLVPLWRHRRNPGHPEVRALLDRPRELRTTFDAGLQLRGARALDAALEARGLRAGAVVVLDAASGDLLAAASAPRPAGPLRGERSEAPPEDALLDRARFGTYPPGSAFKIVTAMAALAKDPSLAGATFGCVPLPGNRAGAVVDGRVVRDHRSESAHGEVGLEDALVHSCNAYFAQLGRSVGFEALAGTAGKFGIGIGSPTGAASRRALAIDAGFGQGAVTATPLQMARAAEAIADGGVAPETRWQRADEKKERNEVVSQAAARTIGAAMRGVVLRGTGRRLAGEPIAIAGKTGTAEAGAGEAHAWFVGYAPHGGAGDGQGIAFAVLLEHGGYGGAGAAEVAGEVVRAADDLGLLEGGGR